ncbi:probable elongator complex protein 2 [Folsomia candida]|uniref:probable elongator complex protein 2 n=1 Tax=Folsomia candida TaxID=158441 RepID=UPI000B904E88|nr:probable elongator complex protein 2 [Folsomia candida]
MEARVEYISAVCNCTYNCLEVTDSFVLFGTNKALAIYDLDEEKVTSTYFCHEGRVNCVRFVKTVSQPFEFVVSCCAGGRLILLENCETPSSKKDVFKYKPLVTQQVNGRCNTVCDGIQLEDGTFILGCITAESEIFMYSTNQTGSELVLLQEIRLNRSLANDLAFHAFEDGNIILALAMDTGAVALYDLDKSNCTDNLFKFVPVLTLQKHEDWVRCLDFVTLETGDTLLATGGQDSFIAVWKFSKSKSDQSSFEFQVHQYKDYNVVFDSMIIGHEGWINSLHWNFEGELLSCSSDQSIIIWENLGDIWMEKDRLGVTGGMVPGGCCAKYFSNRVVSSGFQGAVQIWNYVESQWQLRPSITGHFRPISDMDYDCHGNYVVTTSEDQTTRIHAPWGKTRWHEISRPQIHGHDLFACRTIGEMIVSGAEEKILRAFQPTEIFYTNLQDASGIRVEHANAAKAAFLPSLGLSNITEDTQTAAISLDLPLESRLDEDFIRSQTLWLEVSKLYGHVFEIACIATSPVDPLIASASQATKHQFAAIILWCSKRWKNLGEFPHHKLNVTGMEFSPDGSRLLSVSRDRTWVVWKVMKTEADDFKIEMIDNGSIHTRALWVGTWSPRSNFFVTGARDKKLIIWGCTNKDGNEKYEPAITETFSSSVSGAAVNSDNVIAIGLETGEVELFQYDQDNSSFKNVLKLDCSYAHHDTVKRLRFNPSKKSQLASAGADNIFKIFEIANSGTIQII